MIIDTREIGRKKVYEPIKNGSIRTLPCDKGYKITKVSVIDYVMKSDFPESKIEALAHCLMPDILEYFNSDERKTE